MERVTALVANLLSLPDNDIQVVVLDNNSTDGTFEALSKINDPRFIYASNPVNRGALFNMVNVFSYATGEYVIYSTDQDSTNVDQL
jgi:glycosyltransferase involved in cell wall biosynthesis